MSKKKKISKNIKLLIGVCSFSALFLLLKKRALSAHNSLNIPVNSDNLLSQISDFIIPFEGFSQFPYGDFKQNSIGYGTKALGPEDKVNKEQALQRLFVHLKKYVLPEVNKYNLNTNQKIALSSFLYNLGSFGSNFKKYLLDRDYDNLKGVWLSYNKAGGKIHSGLVKRRKAEFQKFIS